MTNDRMREVPEADAAKVFADPILKEQILKGASSVVRARMLSIEPGHALRYHHLERYLI